VFDEQNGTFLNIPERGGTTWREGRGTFRNILEPFRRTERNISEHPSPSQLRRVVEIIAADRASSGIFGHRHSPASSWSR
jgi:hypothetical protein